MLQAVQKTLVNYSPGYPSPQISSRHEAVTVRIVRIIAKKDAPSWGVFSIVRLFSKMLARQTHAEAVAGFVACGPNFASMGLHNGAGNGQTKTKASRTASGRIRPVKPFKYPFQFFLCNRLAGIGYRQKALIPAMPL